MPVWISSISRDREFYNSRQETAIWFELWSQSLFWSREELIIRFHQSFYSLQEVSILTWNIFETWKNLKVISRLTENLTLFYNSESSFIQFSRLEDLRKKSSMDCQQSRDSFTRKHDSENEDNLNSQDSMSSLQVHLSKKESEEDTEDKLDCAAQKLDRMVGNQIRKELELTVGFSSIPDQIYRKSLRKGQSMRDQIFSASYYRSNIFQDSTLWSSWQGRLAWVSPPSSTLCSWLMSTIVPVFSTILRKPRVFASIR